MSDENALLTIGELARRTGTATSTLRYYERIGILAPGDRVGGRRHYPPSSAERIALIHLYQEAGFSLAEIRQLLSEGVRRRRSWNRLAENKIEELDARIAEAQHARTLLEHALGCPHLISSAAPTFGPRCRLTSHRTQRQAHQVVPSQRALRAPRAGAGVTAYDFDEETEWGVDLRTITTVDRA